jgi:hypothetical protein
MISGGGGGGGYFGGGLIYPSSGMGVGLNGTGFGTLGGSPGGVGFSSGAAPVKTRMLGQDQIPPRAYVADSMSCPFRKDKGDEASALLGGVTSALSDLKAKCPALETTLANLDQQANNLRNANLMLGQNSVDGTVPVTCGNYESVLRREFDFVSGNPSLRISKSSYTNCMGLSASDLSSCMENSYVESLAQNHFNCAQQEDKDSKVVARRNLQAFVDQMNTLIDQSASCDKNGAVKQSLLSASVDTLAMISSMAPVAGFSGELLTMSGPLMNNMVNRLFTGKGPSEGIEAINNEIESENISCLWYNLQNRTLNCQQSDAQKNVPKPVSAGTCVNVSSTVLPLPSAKMVSDLDKVLTAAVGKNDLSNLPELMNAEIPGSDGKGSTSYNKMLDEISQTLSKSTDPARKSMGVQVGALKKNIDEFTSSLGFKPTSDSAAAKISAALPKNWEDIAKAYQAEIGADGAVRRLQASEDIKTLTENGYKLALAAHEKSFKADDYQQSLGVASSYMVTNFQKLFNERLKLLNQRYVQNKDQESAVEKLGDLKPLFAMCSQAASMFYASPVSDPKVSRSLAQIRNPGANETYHQACDRFQCSKLPSPFKLFKESDFTETSLSQKYKAYQCQQVAQYDTGLSALEKNVKDHEEPCAK